jgi:hypothetical protein
LDAIAAIASEKDDHIAPFFDGLGPGGGFHGNLRREVTGGRREDRDAGHGVPGEQTKGPVGS